MKTSESGGAESFDGITGLAGLTGWNSVMGVFERFCGKWRTAQNSHPEGFEQHCHKFSTCSLALHIQANAILSFLETHQSVANVADVALDAALVEHAPVSREIPL